MEPGFIGSNKLGIGELLLRPVARQSRSPGGRKIEGGGWRGELTYATSANKLPTGNPLSSPSPPSSIFHPRLGSLPSPLCVRRRLPKWPTKSTDHFPPFTHALVALRSLSHGPATLPLLKALHHYPFKPST
jgi:hypothetical protein